MRPADLDAFDATIGFVIAQAGPPLLTMHRDVWGPSEPSLGPVRVASAARATGIRVLAYHADVSSKPGVQAMVARILQDFGTVHAVVNNAGILRASDVGPCPEDLWDSVMDVNAKGTFLVTQALLPAMKAQGYGRICNIASIGGKHGAPEQAHYSASKAAAMGFTRVLAQEVGPFGITANCI